MIGSAPLGSEPIGGATERYIPDYYEDLSIFMPLEIRNPVESKYFQLHLKAFIDNQNLNNDYALLALHHLFMFVSYGLLYSSLRRNISVAQHVFLIAPIRSEERQQLQSISSLFTLSFINERTFFDLMIAVGCDMTEGMAPLKKLVDDRNTLAHCNGQYCVNFEKDVMKYIEGFEVLHSKFAPLVKDNMLEINTIDFDVDDDGQIDQLKTLFSDNYISQKMVELSTPPVRRGGLTLKSNKLLNSYLLS